MEKILTSEEIIDRMNNNQIKYMFSGMSAAILFLTGFVLLFYDKDIISGALIFISVILTIFSSYSFDVYDKYNKYCSFEKINTLLEDIKPYPDLQEEFKKRYARGFLLTIEYNDLKKKFNLYEAFRQEKVLQQEIQLKINKF